MTASVKPAGPNYTVKDVETIAAGKDVRARLFTLAPGEVIPWHSISEIADHFFVLVVRLNRMLPLSVVQKRGNRGH